MSEAVVLEDNMIVGTSEPTEVEDENVHDLEDWDYTHYLHIFPEECKDQLLDYFTTCKRGWKARARKVRHIANQYQYIEDLKTDLIDYCLREHTFGPKVQTNRTRLRAVFGGKTQEQREKAAAVFGIDASMYAQNELIEVLCDAMEAL